MSIIQVEKALHDFSVKKMGSAIVLKGEWGTGKTFLWNSVIEKYRADFAHANYSYVSLFGINSLADLKRSIFENTVPSKKAGDVTSKDSVVENLKKLDFSDGVGWLRRNFGHGREAKIPFVGSFGGVIDSIQYSLVTETIVCIDDFERRGNSLAARDVLGLVSNLIEKKNCSVILILNEGSLKPDDEFFTYSEKVFDYEVVFSPSVQESVSLVFNPSDETRKIVSGNVAKLKINNVRLLKKVDYFAGLLHDRLNGCQEQIKQQAYKILPLAILSIYGGKSAVVDIDFVLNYEGNMSGYRLPGDEPTPEELAAQAVIDSKIEYLESYGFGACDEFDVAIIDLVKKGYADDESLQNLVQTLESKIKHEEDIALLQKAWNVFHASFLNNDDEVFAAFDLAMDVALVKFTINDLDSIASIYYDVGKIVKINEAIDVYFSEVIIPSDIREKSDIFRWPSNVYIQQKLEEYFDSLVIEKSLSELMDYAYNVSGFDSADVRNSVAKKTEAEYLEYFSNLNDYNFTNYVRMCLKCGQVSSPDKDIQDGYQNVFVKTYHCLMKMSEGSLLNKARMSKFQGYETLYAQAVQKLASQQGQPE
ncbi:P-loop NTPase fold protein [Pseudomonas sp. MWU349]|uniref:P-loop NTPase fold protein n=1 Tax=Pseudomonas sp. MWU349 TaxID=2802572 RepID=UPI001B31D003